VNTDCGGLICSQSVRRCNTLNEYTMQGMYVASSRITCSVGFNKFLLRGGGVETSRGAEGVSFGEEVSPPQWGKGLGRGAFR